MLLSRFWYVLLALALGASAFTLYVSAQMYNRTGSRAMSEALGADSSSVDWFLRDDARKRAAAIIPMALSPEVGEGLAKASGDAKIAFETRSKIKAALNKLVEDVPADLKFDTVWAVDATGRVVVSIGKDSRDDKDIGGHAGVADALHGWIRDDAWVEGGKVARVVMRPVEREAQSEPVGAIIGVKMVDDTFARAVMKRTGAAVGFYADNARVASGSPEGFDPANLDQITSDLKGLESDKAYSDKGRSDVRVLSEHLGVVYARMPGEAWDLGAGYAVGRLAVGVKSPFDFLAQADNSDKEKVPTKIIILLVIAIASAGLAFSFFEHNRPMSSFHADVLRLARGEIDMLQPSRFRGAYKKIAADLNDGIEKVAAKGGAPRRAADLEQVLGPIPAQPQMSAFAVPGPGSAPVESPSGSRPVPRPPPTADRSAPRLRQSGQSGAMPAVAPPPDIALIEDGDAAQGRPPPPRRPPPGLGATADGPLVSEASRAVEGSSDFDELDDWRRVYEEFLSVKRQCGEPTTGLSFEKFKGTLQRNKDALVARHNCTRVKFTVYVKDGKAALKASPVK